MPIPQPLIVESAPAPTIIIDDPPPVAPVKNPDAVTIDPSLLFKLNTPVPELYDAPDNLTSVNPVKKPDTLNVFPEFVVNEATPFVGMGNGCKH